MRALRDPTLSTGMLDFDAACTIIRALPARVEAERLRLDQVVGRVLAEPVFAALDIPRHVISAMDGYAVRDPDLARLPARLRVLGPVLPGQTPPAEVAPGCCLRVFTGSRVPLCMDRVVIQEEVQPEGQHALFATAPTGRSHLRARGSDLCASDQVLAAGSKIDACRVVALAAADTDEVTVYRRPAVAIIATGDELRAPGRARASENGIPESVSFGVAAFVQRWGGECVHRTWLPDALHRLEAAAVAALEAADLVVVIGGASVGDKDYARRMFASLGLEVLFSKVAIKPAKPVWLGKAAGKLVLGLPGNPTSAMIAARLFLAPLLERIGGCDAGAAAHWIQAPLAAALDAGGERERFRCASWTHGKVRPLHEHDSGAQSSLVDAQLLIRVRAHAQALPAGALADVLVF